MSAGDNLAWIAGTVTELALLVNRLNTLHDQRLTALEKQIANHKAMIKDLSEMIKLLGKQAGFIVEPYQKETPT